MDKQITENNTNLIHCLGGTGPYEESMLVAASFLGAYGSCLGIKGQIRNSDIKSRHILIQFIHLMIN